MAEENKLSLIQYLPEIYRQQAPGKESDFLERFLSIFDQLFDTLHDRIAAVHEYFDPDTVPDESTDDFIPWLAQWLSLDLYELLGEKNREFILKAVEFYKKKGTVDGISKLVELLTGKKCCVKEYMNNVFRTYGMEHVKDPLIETSPDEEEKCKTFYHKTSWTVNTADRSLLEKMGTHEDGGTWPFE
jgi:phage tail-like protein